MNKDNLRELLKEQKEETLLKNSNVIGVYRWVHEENETRKCDLLNDPITLQFCETKEEKQKWTAFVHLTSSAPWRGAVGRQIKLFIKCNKTIIGMVHLCSPLAQLRLRDAHINSVGKDKWKSKILNSIYNLETCVPTRQYANLLTGKLLVYCVFSSEVADYLIKKYNDDVIGFETTSLYGKSSMYNRIPFFKYLGLTDGNSAVYISDENWKSILAEYYKVYPNTKTNRLAPVKFQIVDKLSKYYQKNNIEFPYKYQSIEFKRGVYFGYIDKTKTLDQRVNEWRTRWLKNRLRRVDLCLS